MSEVAEWLYRTGVGAYHLGISLAARLGNPQAREWVAGRQQDVSDRIHALHRAGRPIVWMHAASLGEFEQGRPVLEALREARPEWAVVLTFFSPSGYRRCHGTAVAEVVAYLPRDGARAAADWLDLLRPRMVLFVKYEFWYNHLRTLHARGVPTFLIAGSFRSGQLFFRPYGGFYRRMLGYFTHLLVQTIADRELLGRWGIQHVTVTGDPRVDRTAALARTDFTDARLAAFTRDHPTLFAGSVWPADVELLAGAWASVPDEWRLVLAPHQLDERQLRDWQQRFGADRYTADGPTSARVLLLDTVGILSRAYRYGTVAYVGGALGAGLHNTLEPMSYGLPVVFGPRYQKFPEAREAVRRGGAFSVSSAEELGERLATLRGSEQYAESQAAQRAFIAEHSGAGKRTAALLLRLLPLLLLCLPLGAQRWSTADRLTQTLDGLYAKCNLMVAISGTEWRPGLCLAAAELARDQTVSLELHLEVASKHVFIASAAPGATDIDLYVRNAAGELVASDTEADQTPIVELTVDSAATYTIQVHYVEGGGGTTLVGLGLLRSFGVPLPNPAFRDASRQFSAAAGAVRAAGGAKQFYRGKGSWCLFGHLLEEGQGATVERLPLTAGQYFFAATGPEAVQDIDLYLAGSGPEILASDPDHDAYPMIEYTVTEPGPYRLRLEVERAGQYSLVLLGLFSN